MQGWLRAKGARRVAWAIGISLLLAAPAQAVDWNDMAGASTVSITTTNEDGTPRETTIWLLVVDGFPYVRTGSTRWGGNAERSPDVRLQVGERSFLLRAVPVTDPALIERLRTGLREKYGWEDVAVRFLPGAGTKFFRLDPRPGT